MDHLPLQICINKIKNKVTFKIKSINSLKPLTLETIILARGIEQKLKQIKKEETAPKLEITKVILVPCNLVKNIYQRIRFLLAII